MCRRRVRHKHTHTRTGSPVKRGDGAVTSEVWRHRPRLYVTTARDEGIVIANIPRNVGIRTDISSANGRHSTRGCRGWGSLGPASPVAKYRKKVHP